MSGEAKVLVVDVVLDGRSAGPEATYTYKANADSAPGMAYTVQLGPRQEPGIVWQVRQVSPDELDFPIEKLRALGPRIPELDLGPETRELADWICDQTLASRPMVLSLFLPSGLRSRLEISYRVVQDPPRSITAEAQSLFEIIQGTEKYSPSKDEKKRLAPSLKQLTQCGAVTAAWSIKSPRAESAKKRFRLTTDEAKLETFLREAAVKKPAQALALMRLQGATQASLTASELRAVCHVSAATIQALVSAGLIEEMRATISEPSSLAPPTLNPQQKEATEAIIAAIDAARHESFLLYGVTGSGKTEVYLRAAEAALRWGRSVLYLVPEIALTAQVISQLRARFGDQVTMLHSNLTPTERLRNWLRVKSGQSGILLGPRSALFAPIANLGLIILDEEHEGSYKQEVAPRYHSREVALRLGEQRGVPVVLGSATPALETRFAAEQGRHRLLQMPSRVASARLPEVHIVDLAELYQSKQRTIFSAPLAEAIDDVLARDEQVMLFLNRRSYAPFIVCRDCGHRFQCPDCSVTLSYHRNEGALRCHQCDHHTPAPEVCPECGSSRIGTFGIGSEKVEEAVKETFPQAKVGRLDRDVASRAGALESVLSRFRSKDLNVLVGTQMVAKGLDFPEVTLVGVVAADISLNVPDFRASERTFQLLSQVSGRAGRGVKPGRVFIQTLSPKNEAIKFVKAHDYDGFYQAAVAERDAAKYPPFVRLVNVIFTGENLAAVRQLSEVAAARLRQEIPHAQVLGPATCPLERIQKQWRRHLIIKLKPHAEVQPIGQALKSLKHPHARVTIDVDPYSLM